jgi:hypothetical protein
MRCGEFRRLVVQELLTCCSLRVGVKVHSPLLQAEKSELVACIWISLSIVTRFPVVVLLVKETSHLEEEEPSEAKEAAASCASLAISWLTFFDEP